MKLNYPGLTARKRGPRVAWRVRVEGNPNRKITISVDPGHPDFPEHYAAARAGYKLDAPKDAAPDRGSMAWLFGLYLDHLSRQVDAGAASPLTLKERRNLSRFVLDQTSEQQRSRGRPYATLPATIPAGELTAFKDRMAATPGKARNVWKLGVAAYDFGLERGHVTVNPFRAVPRPTYTSQGGAQPWSIDDLSRYRKTHPPGTTAHLALTLFMFTACRIGDAYQLGRQHEQRHGDQKWLAWQPSKKGSRFVQIPILPPLEKALQLRTVIGATYLTTEQGKPFASPEALRNRFKKWCVAAGLPDRSSHGIRKAAGHLLALHGATQYEIMSIHGHANAATSQVYTETVERMRLGEMGASKLAGLDW